ncbi:hypothetical protein Pcinc_039007 [Petrolisthes cinctipes]|uniref:Uncharacterized protein n=1 Tax=Petrolisthes cinctipes TaxID=88211 RepID=A0AAE1EL16_PETCI|nr:hypothetical protein Pcinc_039007 [Petrolisthes cinctipes]
MKEEAETQRKIEKRVEEERERRKITEGGSNGDRSGGKRKVIYRYERQKTSREHNIKMNPRLESKKCKPARDLKDIQPVKFYHKTSCLYLLIYSGLGSE